MRIKVQAKYVLRLSCRVAILGTLIFITSFLHSFDLDSLTGIKTASAKTRYGIEGLEAPELNLENWIDGNGKPIKTIKLSDYRGKVIYMYFFQDWCPGCHSHGFPTLQKLTETFKDTDRVKFLAVQTAFEGRWFNTEGKLRKNQVKYGLKIPMAHDAGDELTDYLPSSMLKYRSGGTPWTVIIDPTGRVVYNHFHIDANKAIPYIKNLIAESIYRQETTRKKSPRPK